MSLARGTIDSVTEENRWQGLDDDAVIQEAATYTHGPIPQTPPLGLVIEMMRRLEQRSAELEQLKSAAVLPDDDLVGTVSDLLTAARVTEPEPWELLERYLRVLGGRDRVRALLAELPPRPWHWTRERSDIEVPPEPGWALLDVSGAPVIQSEGGYGWLELGVNRNAPDTPIGRFLVEAPELLEQLLANP